MEISKNSLAIAFLVALATTIPLIPRPKLPTRLPQCPQQCSCTGKTLGIWYGTIMWQLMQVTMFNGSTGLCIPGGLTVRTSQEGSGDLSGSAAVKLWVDEKPKYDYNSNTCVGGECRHYTQVVWRKSVRLGCAKARCNNGGTIISCNYDPPWQLR
uniref:SCP domain-containing protein n=1 Tax=Salix viminalis TaxID=40686 RepID=A0A6N2LW90_SALVM